MRYRPYEPREHERDGGGLFRITGSVMAVITLVLLSMSVACFDEKKDTPDASIPDDAPVEDAVEDSSTETDTEPVSDADDDDVDAADADEPIVDPDGVLEILAGDEEGDPLEVVEEGDVLTWEQGFQGGVHLWVGSRVTGELAQVVESTEPADVLHSYHLFDEDGEELAWMNRYGYPTTVDDGFQSHANMLMLFGPVNPEETAGLPHEFTASVSIEDDVIYETSLWIELDCCHWL